jgi:hypothetical protein
VRELIPDNRIDYHPGREQPYTVWYKGLVVAFCFSQAEATMHLDLERRREW